MTILLPVIAHALGMVVDSTSPIMSHGISRELAMERAAQVSRLRYELTLDVTARDSATGHVTVRFDWSGRGDVILDFRGRSLGRVAIGGRTLEQPEWNGSHLRLPRRSLHARGNTLDIDFASAIAPAGASIIRFHDTTDGADYLYTLLVPADANALFPCFDQPDLKARVTMILVAPRGWTALANGATLGADSIGRGIRFRFAETEPISTYLIAFAAGPWSRISRRIGDREIEMYVRASRAREVEADSLLETNARAVAWLADYFARPYPFRKFAFLLAPAFPFGGMEHPGAIFYNEESFIYRERPTLTQRLGREGTIYHEVAHQWFGDLVTMRWFDDLWLKEGFATYMAAKMQAALDPASSAWKTFYLRNKPAAYAVDASEGTTPVWQQLTNLDQAKSNYGAIVYNKAPAVLKQLNYLVGERAFRTGLRNYLSAHAYANATWRDLLHDIGSAAHRPLDAWGREYILRPGMPVFEQRWPSRDSALTIVQRPARALSGPAPWPARIQVLFGSDGGKGVRVPVTVRGRVTRIAAPRTTSPTYVFANAEDYGYGIVTLDSSSARWVEAHIGSVRDDFERAMLWGALWDLVRQARLPPARFAALAMREISREPDEQLVSGIASHLVRATEAYLSAEMRDSLRPELERILLAGANDSARPYGIRKSQLDAFIALAATRDGLARLDHMLDSGSAAGEALRPPTRWSIVTSLIERGSPTGEARLEQEALRDSTTEGRRRVFVAGAARPTADSKAAYFSRYLKDAALNEDWVTASLRPFNSLSQERLTLRFLEPALDTLPWIQGNRRIFFLGAWLGAFLDGHATAEALATVEAFLSRHPDLPRDLRQKILQSTDELKRTVEIREKR
ncbi:MAG: M1 family aminopeptidase [Gemmatimonadota bacterium]|nr:M1 family aminopeptidase [Gemmatimonadota bacterium]